MKWIPTIGRIIFPLASAYFLALIFFKFVPGWFVFVGFIPFLFFLSKSERWPITFSGGFAAGFLYAFLITLPLSQIEWAGFASSENVFFIATQFAGSIVTGIFWGLFALAGSHIRTSTNARILVIPSLWILISEMFRSSMTFGSTYGFLGYLVDGVPLIPGIAAVSGVLGLSFLIILVNVIGYMLLDNFLRSHGKTSFVFPTVAALVVLAALPLFHFAGKAGLIMGRPLRVAAVQSNTPGWVRSFHDVPYVSLLNEAKLQNPDIILFPEGLFVSSRDEPNAGESRQIIAQSLHDILGDFRGLVIFGDERREGNKWHNSLFFWEGGKEVGAYDKQQLVPFAEYRPLWFEKFAPQSAFTYEPGTSDQIIATDKIQIAAFICQEAMYPDVVRGQVRRGAELIVSGANDGSVLDSQFFLEEHRLAKFRAIENGRYLIRATRVGITSIIDPDGREVAMAGPGAPKVITGEVRLMRGTTPYTRFGDIPLLLLVFGISGWWFLALLRKSQRFPAVAKD